jgi:hypothetical protein
MAMGFTVRVAIGCIVDEGIFTSPDTPYNQSISLSIVYPYWSNEPKTAPPKMGEEQSEVVGLGRGVIVNSV